jgi:PST family polysaccharide transporter
MLVINAGQRIIGLARGLGFCHFLNEDQLGGWALANSFFVLGVPLALLGLPGGFSRFVAHYRQQGQLGTYVGRVLAVAGLGLVATLAWMLMAPQHFNWLVFNQPQAFSVSLCFAAAFVALILYSVVYELVTAFQHVRTMSIMQFVQSTSFAALGLPLIAWTHSWTSLLVAYAIANVLAILPGAYMLWTERRGEFKTESPLPHRAMWLRIVPYAASLWGINFLSNSFEVCDRYMLLHLHVGGTEAAQAAIGQYHCGRILPNLVVSVALMLGGVLLPFLSMDWEAGRKREIAERLRQMLKATVVILLAACVGILTLSPMLFQFGFGDRYATAEAILPLTLLHAIWVSLFLLAESYLLCAEKGQELAALLLAGLGLNLVLNWSLIHIYGLQGAVAATTASSILVLFALYKRMETLGCRLGPSLYVLTLAPAMLLAGPVLAALGFVALVMLSGRTNWLFSQQERDQLDALILPKLQQLRLPLVSLWP